MQSLLAFGSCSDLVRVSEEGGGRLYNLPHEPQHRLELLDPALEENVRSLNKGISRKGAWAEGGGANGVDGDEKEGGTRGGERERYIRIEENAVRPAVFDLQESKQ